jgi:hypothetical protein
MRCSLSVKLFSCQMIRLPVIHGSGGVVNRKTQRHEVWHGGQKLAREL